MHLWQQGFISGEMHLGTGEEAIVAGVVDHLCEGDAMALDHRGTSPLLMRGVDPVLLVQELLGHSDGLCSGMGGHMHMFSPHWLAASSGIVGASGPAAIGFALAAIHLRPGTVSIAFFGEGAMNQGMMLEAMNLAVAWKLPVLFVCKDNQWAITTQSSLVTGGKLVDRAHGFGMPATEVDGSDVEEVWHATHEALERGRVGEGSTFLHAHCVHHQGHFLGDPLLRITHHPVKEMKKISGPLLQSVAKRKGASIRARVESLRMIVALIGKSFKEQSLKHGDPLKHTRQKLKPARTRLQELEESIIEETQHAVEMALKST